MKGFTKKIIKIMAIIFDVYLLSESFLTMILYIWSRRNKNTVLHIFGLFPLKAPYVTWFFYLNTIYNFDKFIGFLCFCNCFWEKEF